LAAGLEELKRKGPKKEGREETGKAGWQGMGERKRGMRR